MVPNEKKSVLCQERGGREDNHLVLRPLPMQTRPSAYNSFYLRFQADINVSFVYCQVFGCLRISVGYGGRVGVDDWCWFGCGCCRTWPERALPEDPR